MSPLLRRRLLGAVGAFVGVPKILTTTWFCEVLEALSAVGVDSLLLFLPQAGSRLK